MRHNLERPSRFERKRSQDLKTLFPLNWLGLAEVSEVVDFLPITTTRRKRPICRQVR